MTESYVCVDLETTGLNPKEDRIIEIGAVKVEKGKQTAFYQTLVNPGRGIEDKITALTGLSDAEVKDAPDITSVIGEFLTFAGESVLLGHSVLFDYSFLKKAAVNSRLPFEREGIDTLKIARKYLASLESRSLDYLCRYYAIPHNAHRAMEDARATCLLYERLREEFLTKETEKEFTPEKLIYQVKREQPATRLQKERLYKLLEKHKLLQDLDVDKLTRNEASRYTDKLLAKYGR